MEKLLSRKFWVAVLGVLIPYVSAIAGVDLSGTMLAANAAIAAAYILGETAVDFANACIDVAKELRKAIDESIFDSFNR